MKRKEITLVVIPNYQSKSYTKTFSLRTIKFLFVLLMILIIGLGAAIFIASRFYYQLLKIGYLTRRNAQLEAEYTRLQLLKERLTQLELESQKIKNMLGVDKSPPKIDFLSLAETELAAVIDITKPSSDSISPELANQLKNERIRYIPSQPPLSNYVISRRFDSTHTGIDLVAPLGTPVSATADGIIKEVGEDTIYGKYVLIEHGSDYTSFYGHLRRIIKNKGDTVAKGDFIGYLGETGMVSAPHLHFEITYQGKKIDPAKLLRLKSRYMTRH